MRTPDLELGASQALFAARALEDALHTDGQWEMAWGDLRAPAERTITDKGVLFTATFPDLCWLDRPEGAVVLLLDGEARGIKRVDDPGDTAFTVTWAMAVRVPAYL